MRTGHTHVCSSPTPTLHLLVPYQSVLCGMIFHCCKTSHFSVAFHCLMHCLCLQSCLRTKFVALLCMWLPAVL